ncbi:MAG: hypothetical protein U0871_16335 [Gemmataceae bacterium]
MDDEQKAEAERRAAEVRTIGRTKIVGGLVIMAAALGGTLFSLLLLGGSGLGYTVAGVLAAVGIVAAGWREWSQTAADDFRKPPADGSG